MNIKQINDINVEITENEFINTSKGIVYIYDHDFTSFELLQCGLKESKIIGNVEIAKWITDRNPLSKALLVTFHQLIPPEYIDGLYLLNYTYTS